MQVGAISESVSVTGEAPVLQTDTTQVGSVIASDMIDATPLISRNPVALTLLTAGVTTPDPGSFNNGLRSTGGGRPYVNGNREESNNFLLDGVDNNFTSDNLVSYQPNTDAIEEFKLITNNAPAEFGNFQGGIINVVLKSGTNQLHGSVFEDLRNDKLNAGNWGRNWQGLPARPSAGISSAVSSAAESSRTSCSSSPTTRASDRRRPRSSASTSVMPAAWRTGDFSRSSIRLSAAKVPSSSTIRSLWTATTGLRAPFMNNIIPQSSSQPCGREAHEQHVALSPAANQRIHQ